VFGDRAIANVALRSQFGAARFRGGFFGSAWPWWRGGLALGWFGPLFWPYARYEPDGTDLPIDLIAQAVQPTPAQRAAWTN